MEPWLGHGLFTAPVSTWRVNRKLIAPSFNPRVLARFVEVFSSKAHILVQKLSQEAEGAVFDIFHYVNLCSLDAICETAMGLDVGAQHNSDPDYIRSTERLSQIVSIRIFKVWLHPNWLFNLTWLSREQTRHLQYTSIMTSRVVQQKRQEFKKHSDSEDASSRKVFIDLLLESAETRFTDRQLMDEVTTMTVAGNDTTATMTSFVLLLLAMHPGEQDKVREELQRIFGDSERAAMPQDLRDMQQLELCIKETMRMFPVAPLIGRHLTGDVALSDVVLPTGSSVVICIQHLHRDREQFPEPDKFIPERFLPTNQRHPFSYLPFSAGARNCIGLRYAMLLMKTIVSTVLRRYHISTPLKMADILLKVDILLKSVHGFPIRLHSRTAA